MLALKRFKKIISFSYTGKGWKGNFFFCEKTNFFPSLKGRLFFLNSSNAQSATLLEIVIYVLCSYPGSKDAQSCAPSPWLCAAPWGNWMMLSPFFSFFFLITWMLLLLLLLLKSSRGRCENSLVPCVMPEIKAEYIRLTLPACYCLKACY